MAAYGWQDNGREIKCGAITEDDESAPSEVVAGRRRPFIAAVPVTVVSVEMGYESLFMQ